MVSQSPDAAVYETDDLKWDAVRSRAAGADSIFLFSVRTTGVYCRPSCAARLPRRENVAFHANAAAAEAAGFRPCKRCRPKGPTKAELHAEAIARACKLIDEAEALPSLSDMADAAGLSPHYFHRIFRKVTGVTPRAYAVAKRAQLVRNELEKAPSIADAIYGSGFSGPGRFYAATPSILGMTPSAYREGGTGETVRFAVGQSSLGAVLVAATERGVCAILMGDEPDELVKDLQDRFRNAELVGADATFDELVARVIGIIEQPGSAVELPLDIKGTAFQERVWRALRQVPPGSTVSYSELARRIGEPSSFRAVAQACGANPLAVAVPCHRVVRTDGSLSGYRWGVERKKELLEREAAVGL